MSDKKKPYRWRAYLDDFRTDADGKRYAFDGDPRTRTIYLAKTVLFTLLALLSTVVPECLPPTEISRTPVTLIPWALQLIAALVTVWAVVRIFAHASELRAYVYRATVASLPRKSLILAALSGVTFLAEVLFFFIRRLSPDGFTLSRLICPAVSVAASLLLFRTVRRGRWNELP